MGDERGAGLDWMLLGRYALVVALCELIPIPFLDAWIENRVRRRMVRKILSQHGVQLDDAQLALLADATSAGCMGCFWALVMWPVKKLLKTLLVVFQAKTITDRFSEVLHRALLTEEACELGLLPDRAADVRRAMDPALAHVATRQAHVCVERIAGKHVPDVDYKAMPSCTYCQPQVASVGLTEAAAKAAGIAYKVGKFPFQANGKAQGAGSPEGFVKVLIGEPHGGIVGAHIVGSEATEMIAEFGLARANELTADEILHTVHAHPTYSEAMFEAVAQALGQTVHL